MSYIAAFSALVLLGHTVLSEAQLPPALADSSAAQAEFMVSYLKRIADTADPVVDIYLNRTRAAGIGTLLGKKMSPGQALQLRVKIADELLKGGETQRAIKAYEYIYGEIGRRGLRVDESYYHMLRDMLAIAYLRVYESGNGAPPRSWVFPMREKVEGEAAVGPRRAIELYEANLASEPDDLAARWLLNIAYMAIGLYPHEVPAQWLIPPSTFESEYDIGRFVDVAPRAGVAVIGHAGGSVMEDLDGDGLLDIAASSRGLRDQLRFFHNEGDGTFSDWTQRAGLAGQLGGLNMAHADYDNDGDRDLLVLRGAWGGEAGRHPNSLLKNQGAGNFVDETQAAGLFSLHPTHAAAWGDFDNDGWLDLYVGNESSPAPKPSHPNELFRNNGDGTFAEIAAENGVAHVGFVKGLAWGDYDNDGTLDLYLSHLNGDNALYRNEGGQGPGPRFVEVGKEAGVQEPYVSFPTWFWDYDNDGWQDILVAGFDMADLGDMAAVHMALPFAAEHHRLYRNNGDGTFAEVASEVGLDRVILSMGANFGDLDNDGWLDCYFGTGMPDLRALLPNRMYRNDAGQHFQDVTTAGGFGTLQKGHGISFGDIDHDGDQDIYQVLGAAFEGDIYANVLLENPGHGNSWVTLFLEGVQSNRDAIGARVRVRVKTATGEDRDIYVTVGTGGSFGSSSLRQEIGLGDAVSIDYVEVRWPRAGPFQRFAGMDLDGAYLLREGEAAATEIVLHSYDLSP